MYSSRLAPRDVGVDFSGGGRRSVTWHCRPAGLPRLGLAADFLLRWSRIAAASRNWSSQVSGPGFMASQSWEMPRRLCHMPGLQSVIPSAFAKLEDV